MKRNKTISALIAIMLVAMMLSMLTITSMAHSNDTSFSFNYILKGGMDVTRAELKENGSSMYMKCISTDAPYMGCAYGGYTANEVKYDCSGGYVYLFNDNTPRFMYNYVYENNYPLATIMTSTLAFNLSVNRANGVWSPDSVYEAGVLPPSDYIK